MTRIMFEQTTQSTQLLPKGSNSENLYRPHGAVCEARFLHAQSSIHSQPLVEAFGAESFELRRQVDGMELGVGQRGEDLLVRGRH